MNRLFRNLRHTMRNERGAWLAIIPWGAGAPTTTARRRLAPLLAADAARLGGVEYAHNRASMDLGIFG